MPREILEGEYCAWLFDILFELEKRIDTSKMTTFEKHYSGRVSERLFSTWLEYRLPTGNLSREEVKVLPVIYLERINWERKYPIF